MCRQNQSFDSCADSQFCCVFCSQVRETTRHVHFFIQVGGFDYEGIGIANNLDQVVSAACIADNSQLNAPRNRSRLNGRREAVLFLFEQIAQTIGSAVGYGESADAESVCFKECS